MYDLAVIGSGPGGYVAAIRAAQLGLKTICFEKEKELGGTCLNIGCIPSKALLYSTELFYKLQKKGKENGILATDLKADFSQMMQRKQKIVTSFNKGIEFLFKKNQVERVHAHATLAGAHTIQAAGKEYSAKNILLATGSESIALPFLPFDEEKILSSTGALCLKQVPKKLLVIGAGVIGVEMASVYSRLGTEVVFFEFADRICPAFDGAISTALEKSLTAQGMHFFLKHKVLKGEKKGDGIELTVQGEGEESVHRGDAVLICVGRRPYTEKLGLETVGIQLNSQKQIPINASFQTAAPNIFAIGDLVDGPMLAHKASEEGVAVAEFLAGHRPTIDYLSIPNVIYTHPEVASVGLTEEECRARSLSIESAQFPFKANSRARCVDEEEGFVKMIMEKATHKLLGVHIFASQASELIGEAALALGKRLPAESLAHGCHAHPTLSESLKEGAMALLHRAIHI